MFPRLTEYDVVWMSRMTDTECSMCSRLVEYGAEWMPSMTDTKCTKCPRSGRV